MCVCGYQALVIIRCKCQKGLSGWGRFLYEIALFTVRARFVFDTRRAVRLKIPGHAISHLVTFAAVGGVKGAVGLNKLLRTEASYPL